MFNPDTSLTPFVKPFQNNDKYYIYDVNTNQIIEVEKTIHDIIETYHPEHTEELQAAFSAVYSREELLRAFREIEEARSGSGLFSAHRPARISLGSDDPAQLEQFHANGLQQLLLEVTRQCNFKCSYCQVSGEYGHPSGDPENMTWETARQCIDFFCQRLRKDPGGTISFYGGEPLLAIDLIKKAVLHVRERHRDLKINFSITTNGALADEKNLDFLIEHDFNISFSLDGPLEFHDRYRRDRHNGGTFAAVLANLKTAARRNRDFYLNNIRISCVLAPPFDIDALYAFFSENKILRPLLESGKIRGGLVDTRESRFLEDFNLVKPMQESKTVMKKLNARLLELIRTGELKQISLEKTNLFIILHNLARRPIQSIEKMDVLIPHGVCHIGMRRLFATSGGDFHICERDGRHYKIGDSKRGFNFEHIAALYGKLEKTLADCRNCWATLHCERCWATLGNLDAFTGETKERYCQGSKRVTELALKAFTRLLEENPDSLKVFREIEIY